MRLKYIANGAFLDTIFIIKKVSFLQNKRNGTEQHPPEIHKTMNYT